MATVQALKDIGEQMGLKGTDLREFIKEQQDLEREERNKQRAYEMEQQDKQQQQQDKQRAYEEKQKQCEMEQQEKQRTYQKEQEERQILFEKERIANEKEKQEREAKQRELEREFELERMKLDRQKMELELKLKGELKTETGTEEEVNEEVSVLSGHTRQTGVKGPKMPYFDDRTDDMDAFLHRFEIYAASQNWKKEQWAVYLSALLKGKALEVYSRMPVAEAQDYDKLKDALLKRFNLTEEGFKLKFKTAKPEIGEAPAQYIARLESYLTRWIDLANVDKSFEGLTDLMVKEQYLESCPMQLAIFLRERKPKKLEELAELAEQYMDAHASNKNVASRPSVPPAVHEKKSFERQDRNDSRVNRNEIRRNLRPDSARTCHNCGKVGHIARYCFGPRKVASAMTVGNTGQRHFGKFSPNKQYWNNGGDSSRSFRQYNRPQNVEQSSQNRDNMTEETQVKERVEEEENQITCKAHGRIKCNLCLNYPIHKCNAMKATEVKLECGCTFPVIADACCTGKGNMPVSEGYVNGEKVSVLRDTGCSTVVIRRDLVRDEQWTGKEEICLLIDGTVRRAPVASVEIDTPFFSGLVTAVCMDEPLYDVIIGNISNAKDIEGQKKEPKLQAVMTRAQVLKQTKPPRPLKVIESLGDDITRDKLIDLQQKDASLKKYMEKAEMNPSHKTTAEYYKMKNGILYRYCTDREGQEISQVVVPKGLKTKVMTMAHEAVMSGHQGIKKTQGRIWREFWWKGMMTDVVRFCKSCEVCQLTVSKGRVSKTPLGQMPIIDTPFERVAVDLVGPLPASESGNRYILTMVDYATRYPEATPLKDIRTETVAEALVNMFARVGVPREILSDRGSQFLSEVMKEMCRLLSLKQLVTTPYHPMCNGLVEKYNGTLKTMIKRMASERPKDWDRYIGPLLFAYREVKQESMGFSPFELLYGRTVRGPMRILRELLTDETVDPEVKTTYEYVLDLKDRLNETCELARMELQKAQKRQRRYYNRRAENRIFQVGDKVLVLLPTNTNKLLMQWRGPFEIVEHVRENDYKIKLPNRTKMFHANMLKKYWERDQESLNAMVIEEPPISDTLEGELNLFTKTQTETYKDVKVNPHLTETERREVMQILEEFQDVFSDLPKLTNLGEHSISLTTAEPVYSKPYILPYAIRDEIDKELESMMESGIIERSNSPYASPIVVVKKPDGSNRICVDYRKLNKITIFDPQPMTKPDDIFAKLKEDKWFSTFDVTKGYWQIPMREEDKKFTAFTTYKGLYQFRVMPFGLVNAPATFNRLMKQMLGNAEALDNYVDDVLAHTKDWQSHLKAMKDFLTRLRTANLTLRPSKCSVGFPAVTFLGHRVGNEVLEPKTELVTKILQAPRPVNKKQLRSFLGLTGYYHRFIPNYATVASPLTDLTRKGEPNELQWNNEHERAFETLKARIANPPILKLPDNSKEYVLRTDASNVGIGAVLFQEENDVKHPVAFASRKLLPREVNYSTIEKECLALVWAIQKFEVFLYGKKFLLEVDHKPLEYLKKTAYTNGRLMRWAMVLQQYNYFVRHIKGSQNVGADFMSRSLS